MCSGKRLPLVPLLVILARRAFRSIRAMSVGQILDDVEQERWEVSPPKSPFLRWRSRRIIALMFQGGVVSPQFRKYPVSNFARFVASFFAMTSNKAF